MRNFRKAALAGATAAAIAFGTTAVATAHTETATPAATTTATPTKVVERPGTEATGGSSTKLGHDLEAWTVDGDGNVVANGADGRALFGSSDNAQGVPSFESQPAWAKAFFGVSIFAAVSALIGLVVGPAYNFVVFGPF
ncbi:hypothetical protein [Corynebacterium qintianiae]|uniref:hypothetical protein n=1 Tax=Corynebacterium qintianiae TaxID=2709392 RepID=UPI0013ED3D00|nr:hypothetical protein [Corynebacterium qintianiae]